VKLKRKLIMINKAQTTDRKILLERRVFTDGTVLVVDKLVVDTSAVCPELLMLWFQTFRFCFMNLLKINDQQTTNNRNINKVVVEEKKNQPQNE